MPTRQPGTRAPQETVHALRRMFVVLSIRARMDVVHLQAMLGHASLDMVQHYAQTANEQTTRLTWPAEKIRKAWIVNRADMLEQAMLVVGTAPEDDILSLGGVGRLLSSRFCFLPSAIFTSNERVSLFNAFFKYMQTARNMGIPILLEDRWSNIQQWAQGFYWPSANTGSSWNTSIY